MRFQGLGAVEEYQYSSNSLSGKTTNGYFRITVFSEGVVRVHISRDNSFDKHSYAVVQAPEATQVSFEESEEFLQLSTTEITVTIKRDSAEISMTDSNGNILSQDEPGLANGWLGDTVIAHKSLQKQERFIGLGEKTGPLDRAGHSYIHNNTDAFGYGDGSDPIYCTIPFFIGIHNQLAYGFFMDSTFRSNFNFGASNNRFSSFSADGGDLIYYFIHHKTIPEILESYTWLTGRMTMPPLWSIGYQQCRYSYYPESEVMSISQSFRDRNIPADAIVLDIHYMDQYKIFTWDGERFPNPRAMVDSLREKGFNVVVILDPGIKTEEGYLPYEEGLEQNIFVKYPDGSNYTGEVWPGWCHFPDFTNPRAREWWTKQFRQLTDVGITGFWNDMNEIATWGQSLPEVIEFDFEGNTTSAREGRNAYGLMMSKSSFEAGKANLNGERPFNLTRSAYAGIQRYSAVWTGDNTANEEHMMLGVRLVNSLGLSAVSFSGYDVGGFIGEAGVNLYTRWITIAAFAPFFRGHTMINSRFSEPWTFGEETEDIARNYIEFRYRLTPYIYSSFYESTLSGLPLSRSLAILHPHEPQVYDSDFENQFYFGDSLLVCPVGADVSLAKVFLPEGNWYDLYNGVVLESGEMLCEAPLTRLPVFVKGGAIIPMQSLVQNLKEKHDGTLVLHIYNDKVQNRFRMYEDDGATYQYEKGEYLERIILFDGEKGSLKITTGGNYTSAFQRVKFVLHGFDQKEFEVNGVTTEATSRELCLFPPVSHFDPVIPPKPAEAEDVLELETDLTDAEMTVNWNIN